MNFHKYIFMFLSISSLFSDIKSKSECDNQQGCNTCLRSSSNEECDQFRRANVSANRLDIAGRMDARSEAYFHGNSEFSGAELNINVANTVLNGTMIKNGTFTNNGNVNLVGDVDIDGTLDITGTTTFSGSVNIDGTSLLITNTNQQAAGSLAGTHDFLIINRSTGSVERISADAPGGDTPSARRFKKNIESLDHDKMSSAISKLEPVKYQYKKNPQKMQFGLIADDIVELLPEAVNYNQQGQPDSINYQIVYIAMLDHVIRMSKDHKKMCEEIEGNKQEISALNAKIKCLEAQLEKILLILESEEDSDCE